MLLNPHSGMALAHLQMQADVVPRSDYIRSTSPKLGPIWDTRLVDMHPASSIGFWATRGHIGGMCVRPMSATPAQARPNLGRFRPMLYRIRPTRTKHLPDLDQVWGMLPQSRNRPGLVGIKFDPNSTRFGPGPATFGRGLADFVPESGTFHRHRPDSVKHWPESTTLGQMPDASTPHSPGASWKRSRGTRGFVGSARLCPLQRWLCRWGGGATSLAPALARVDGAAPSEPQRRRGMAAAHTERCDIGWGSAEDRPTPPSTGALAPRRVPSSSVRLASRKTPPVGLPIVLRAQPQRIAKRL